MQLSFESQTNSIPQGITPKETLGDLEVKPTSDEIILPQAFIDEVSKIIGPVQVVENVLEVESSLVKKRILEEASIEAAALITMENLRGIVTDLDYTAKLSYRALQLMGYDMARNYSLGSTDTSTIFKAGLERITSKQRLNPLIQLVSNQLTQNLINNREKESNPTSTSPKFKVDVAGAISSILGVDINQTKWSRENSSTPKAGFVDRQVKNNIYTVSNEDEDKARPKERPKVIDTKLPVYMPVQQEHNKKIEQLNIELTEETRQKLLELAVTTGILKGLPTSEISNQIESIGLPEGRTLPELIKAIDESRKVVNQSLSVRTVGRSLTPEILSNAVKNDNLDVLIPLHHSPEYKANLLEQLNLRYASILSIEEIDKMSQMSLPELLVAFSDKVGATPTNAETLKPEFALTMEIKAGIPQELLEDMTTVFLYPELSSAVKEKYGLSPYQQLMHESLNDAFNDVIEELEGEDFQNRQRAQNDPRAQDAITFLTRLGNLLNENPDLLTPDNIDRIMKRFGENHPELNNLATPLLIDHFKKIAENVPHSFKLNDFIGIDLTKAFKIITGTEGIQSKLDPSANSMSVISRAKDQIYPVERQLLDYVFSLPIESLKSQSDKVSSLPESAVSKQILELRNHLLDSGYDKVVKNAIVGTLLKSQYESLMTHRKTSAVSFRVIQNPIELTSLSISPSISETHTRNFISILNGKSSNNIADITPPFMIIDTSLEQYPATWQKVNTNFINDPRRVPQGDETAL